MKKKNLLILACLIVSIICWSFEVEAFWKNIFSNETEKHQTIEDRKRLVELEIQLMSELDSLQLRINSDVEEFNKLSKRKKCVEDKNIAYSKWKPFSEVSNFKCLKDFKMANVVFQ